MSLTPEMIAKINKTLLFDLPPIKSDVGLIFGQGVYSYLLVAKAVEGLDQNRYPKIIIAGGATVLDTPDAKPLIGFLQHLGVANDDLPNAGEKEADYIFRLLPDFAKAVAVRETESTNTGENIELSKPLGLDKAGSITVVCAASMTARAIATLRKSYTSVAGKSVSSIPVYPPGITADNWTKHPFAAHSMTSEFKKLQQYFDEGHLAAISIDEERDALLKSGLILG